MVEPAAMPQIARPVNKGHIGEMHYVETFATDGN